ncbi:ABC transporter substrate-binding protein [Clostridium sp. DJ247]|uniref:ABC transporter substrate-binding protein n=1 Tax=Clostridium sp. DJ247 TaxID=2726188 RepID=UPI00162AB53F|nr:ABC transporter substrate-binding protein [Clostridium sp. DJ247]MBC2582088.1 ABC transporter substrate-binding protein [Clostridium sp. DJ247]
MKKGILKVASLVTLITLSLSGCGTAAPSTQTNTKAEKVKIEYWHVNAETQGGKSVEKLVKDFNAQSDTVEVVAKYNPDMYKGLLQNLQAEVATGKSPAIVQVGWAFLDYFSNNFSYTEPQKIIDAQFPKDKTFLKDNFLPNVLGLAKNSKDSQVGIPYSLSTPVLYINKDILRKAGLDENGPKTWEELVAFSNTIKEKTGKYGFYMQEPADNWATQALLESNGARMITDGKASFASEEGIKAYEAYADMVVKTKSALHISWNEGVKSFIDGNVGMLYTTIAQRANVQKGATFDVAAINSPAWAGKEKRLPAGGCFLAITAKTQKEQKAAWEFEKYLYSIESMAEWTKGTGYVPPRKDVATAENGLKSFLEQNKMMAAATTQMDGVVSWTSFPGDAGLQAEQILLDTRDKILSGSVSTRDGLKSAQDKINVLLKK